MIESLLITYARTSLNTDGHLDHKMGIESMDQHLSIEHTVWCENLIHRSSSK